MSQQFIDVAFRVDGEDPSDLINFLDEDGGAYFVVKEVADGNHHFHAVLRSRRAVQPLRMAFKRYMPPDMVGNGAYSIAVVRDLDKYHRYLCKGDQHGVWPEVVGANGIQYQDLEWQNAQHEAYWTENARLAGERTKVSVMDAVLDAARAEGLRWTDRERIAFIYIREQAARGKGINTFQVRSAVNLIAIKLCPDDSAIEELARFAAAF